jgi:hypothetical protein
MTVQPAFSTASLEDPPDEASLDNFIQTLFEPPTVQGAIDLLNTPGLLSPGNPIVGVNQLTFTQISTRKKSRSQSLHQDYLSLFSYQDGNRKLVLSIVAGVVVWAALVTVYLCRRKLQRKDDSDVYSYQFSRLESHYI